MSELRTRLIERAVRPFADNAEMNLAATRLLDELAETDDGNAAEATRRWEAVDAKRRKPLWRIALFTVLAIVSAVTLVDVIRETVAYRRLVVSLIGFGTISPGKTFEEKVGEKLDAREKLILFGDPSHQTKAGKMKGLWDSDPENPAYFGEYAKAYLSENDALPPDFLETARRIDPQNSWFTYLAAAVEGKGSVEKRPQSSAAKASGAAREWDIRDPAKVDRALALVHEARSQPRCQNYSREMTRQRIELLPRSTEMKNLRSLAYLAGIPAMDVIYLRHLADTLAAQAWNLGENKDAAGLQMLIDETDAFVGALANVEPTTVLEVLVFKVCADITAKDLGPAAAKLGLSDDAARLTEMVRRFDAHKKAREPRTGVADRNLTGADGGLMASLTLPMLNRQMTDPPRLTAADMKPGRLADHEMASRVSSIGAWVVLLFFLSGAAAYRYRSPALIRRLAKRMESLLRPVDWAWLLGAGIALPLIYAAIFNRLTPLGGRDLGLKTTFLLLPSAQFLGMTVLIILVPVLIARWRFGIRAVAFGFVNGDSRLGWLAAACAAISIPVVGWAAGAASQPGLAVAAGLIAMPSIWIGVVVLRAIFSSPSRLLHRSTAARVLMPVYAAAMLLMVSMIPVFKAAGHHWFARDTVMRLDPAYPSMTRYEYQAAVQMRKELRELLQLPAL